MVHVIYGAQYEHVNSAGGLVLHQEGGVVYLLFNTSVLTRALLPLSPSDSSTPPLSFFLNAFLTLLWLFPSTGSLAPFHQFANSLNL